MENSHLQCQLLIVEESKKQAEENAKQNIMLAEIAKDVKHMMDSNSEAHTQILSAKSIDHEKIFKKIELYVRGQVETEQRMRKSYETLSSELMEIKLRDAGFYGKVVLLSGICAIGATIFLSRMWETIIDFFYRK